ncbi:hypothetical protein DFP73DRAFT_598307 [Morchella snyderi]|nr:hypothetical protein DFP73DRAFT_598307 [Morchella snyderi]
MGDPDGRKELFEKIATLSRILVNLDNVEPESETAREGIRAARDALLSMMASPRALMSSASTEERISSPPAVVSDETVEGTGENRATTLDANLPAVLTEDVPVHPTLEGLNWSFLDPVQGEPAPTAEPDKGLQVLLGYLDEQHPDADDPDTLSMFSIGDRSHCTLGMGSTGAQDHQPRLSIDHISSMVPAVEPPSLAAPPLATEQGNVHNLGADSSAGAFEPADLSFNLLDHSGGNATDGLDSLSNDWSNTALDLPFDPDDTDNFGLYGSVNLELTEREIEAILEEAIAYSNQALGPSPGSVASAPAGDPYIAGLVQTQCMLFHVVNVSIPARPNLTMLPTAPKNFTIQNGMENEEGIAMNNPVVNTTLSTPVRKHNSQTPGNTARDPIVLDLDDHEPANNLLQSSPGIRRDGQYGHPTSNNSRSMTFPRARGHTTGPTSTRHTHSWSTQRAPYPAPRIPSSILPQYVATTTRDYSFEARLAARMRRRQMEMHIERIDEENRNQGRPG